MRNITKVICFGLGELARSLPGAKTSVEPEGNEIMPEIVEVSPAMIQHAVALTIAEEVRFSTNPGVRLLAQDPDYSDDTEELLQSNGFEIVGHFGGGGFAEVDDESLVFSAWVTAPVKQIIADIARPAVFITLGQDVPTFNKFW